MKQYLVGHEFSYNVTEYHNGNYDLIFNTAKTYHNMFDSLEACVFYIADMINNWRVGYTDWFIIEKDGDAVRLLKAEKYKDLFESYEKAKNFK